MTLPICLQGRPTLDGTYWKDSDGKPYMVFSSEWLQNWNGTIEKIELKPDFSGTIGEPVVLFHASDSPWSREKNDKGEITWTGGDGRPLSLPDRHRTTGYALDVLGL